MAKIHHQSEQALSIGDEYKFQINGRKVTLPREILYWVLCTLTGGLFFLLGRWFPRLYSRVISVECEISLSSNLLVMNEHKQFSFIPVKKQFNRVYFDYHCAKFFLDPETGLFLDQFHILNSLQIEKENGLSELDLDERKVSFGPNVIEIEEKSNMQLLIDEVLHPFNVFQIYSITLWCLDDYYLYASCIFIMSCVSAISTLLETKRNIHTLKTLSRFTCPISVLRNGIWSIRSSEDLVPGDVFEISPEITSFPCDAILIQGDLIMNESMLTGESVPVIKTALESSDNVKINIWDSETEARSLVYSGTKVVRVKSSNESEKVLACVYRTAFNTTKGQLIRGILFPKPHKFKFYRDAFKFVGVLAIIAVLGFAFTLYYFILRKADVALIVKRALDLFTIVVPPALPATMSIGMTFALGRLRSKNIFCISPTRVNIGGKLNVYVFDKTGTLTEDGLDVLGVRCVEDDNLFGPLRHTAENMSQSMINAMATCQSIKVVGASWIGDPMDLKMFEFTRWTLEEGAGGLDSAVISVVRPEDHSCDIVSEILSDPTCDPASLFQGSLELGIIRCFDFSSKLRRMSVVVRPLGSNDTFIYAKGAPEIISQICIPESIPSDFKSILDEYVHHGYRVIACAGRRIDFNISWLKVQKAERDDFERDLVFYGLIVFENKLKPASIPTLKILNDAKLKTIMCTGDNILTAISVSKECGILSPKNKPIFYPKFDDTDGMLHWICLDDARLTLDKVTLLPTGLGIESYAIESLDDYEIACCGDSYEFLIENSSKSTVENLLVLCKVYARMSPDLKQNLVERLQELEYYVGFVGDGSNDCGALKAADVGMSLSSAEASVAAPFTSSISDVSCALEIIREGRAALVTSFSCFKYMALYSMIQFTTVSLLYMTLSSLSDPQFLYIDLVLIFPIAVAMGRFPASRKIVPKRPTANLLSRKVLLSLIGHILLQGLCQVFVYYYTQSREWFRVPEMDPETTNVENILNTSLFLISVFLYVLIGVVFVVGKPYQQSILRNRTFMTFVGLLSGVNLIILFSASMDALSGIAGLLVLVKVPVSHSLLITVSMIVYFCISWICEKYVFVTMARALKSLIQAKARWNHLRSSNGKIITKDNHNESNVFANRNSAGGSDSGSQQQMLNSPVIASNIEDIETWKYGKPHKRIRAKLKADLLCKVDRGGISLPINVSDEFDFV